MQPNRPNPLHTQLQPRSSRGEAGYMLLAVVVMTALILLAVSVAAPLVARELRRDKEVESARRAQEYVRAIRLYTKRGAGPYPLSIEALEKTGTVRFLRQQYVDPLTGKADWRLIRQGQQKTTIKIPFGEELSGLGPSSGSSTSSFGSSGSSFGNSTGSGTAPGASSTIGSTSSLAGGFSGATVGSSTFGGGMSGPATTGSGASSSSSSSSSSGIGGGGPIVGVGSSRTGDSIMTPNGQTTYDTWEFWYDPRIELLYKNSQVLGGGGGALGGGGFGIGSGSSSSSSNSSSGSAFGSSGTGSGSGSTNGSSSMGSGTPK